MDCADSSKHSSAMPSIGSSAYYRQSRIIFRNLRSFNLVVRWASRSLRAGVEVDLLVGIDIKCGVEPSVVAALETDLENWLHLY
jgi:hypothetical protein